MTFNTVDEWVLREASKFMVGVFVFCGFGNAALAAYLCFFWKGGGRK